MIDLVASALKNNIVGLPYVERYGGVVKPVTEEKEAEDGRFISVAYPVPVNMTEKECFEQGYYTVLVPNETYLSVSYIEQIAGADIKQAPEKIDAGGKMLVFRERFRFVCWLHLARFNQRVIDDEGNFLVDDQGNYITRAFATTCSFEMAAIKAIKGDYNIDSEGITGKLTVTPISILEKNTKTVFGKYSYANKEWAFLHPYDYFAIDFEAYLLVPTGCVSDMIFDNPVNCILKW